ncbi:MAG: FixH family protein [Bacteroidetes bacterium]|nr:FixH family protein [Bacteroidota bacterium]
MKKFKFNWGHGILIFMTVFVLLSIIFIIFSLNQSQDLVSDDYYDQGASYSKQIEINKRSENYRDSITINQNNLSIDIKLCQSLINLEDTLFVYFYRPSDKKSDVKYKIQMTENISFPSTNLKSGRYMVKMKWNHLENIYNIEKEITIN